MNKNVNEGVNESERKLPFDHPAVSFSPDLGIATCDALEWLIRFTCGCYRRVGFGGEIFNAHFCLEHDQSKLTQRLDGL